MPPTIGMRRSGLLVLLIAVGALETNAQAIRHPVFTSGGRADADGTIFVIGQPIASSATGQPGSLAFGVVHAWLGSENDAVAVQWVCGTGTWSTTSCWTGVSGNDPYPNNGAVNYAVTLPTGSYTVNVDPLAVEIGSLSMPGTGTILSVNSGKSLIVNDTLTAHGRLRSLGTLSSAADATVDISPCDLSAESGGRITLPITTYTGVGGRIEGLTANGAGSVLALSALTSINGAANPMNLQAANGGTVLVPALTSIADASLSSIAPGSLLRLDSLATLPPTVALTVSGGGTVVAAPLIRLDHATVFLSGTTSVLDLSQLVNIDSSTLQVTQGAQVSLPLVTTYLGSAGPERLEASFNSLLEMNALISLDGGANGMTVQAANGGSLRMPAVTSIVNTTISALVAGSVARLDSLASVGPGCRIDVGDGATLIGAPFTTIAAAELNIWNANSVFDTSQVTNLNGTNVRVGQGAVVRFPLVTSYVSASGSALNWLEATNAGAVLDLNSATSIQSLASAGLHLGARFGGRFEARSVQSLPGYVVLRCDGTGGGDTSTLDLGNVVLGAGAWVQIGAIGGGGPSPGGEVWCRGNFSYATTAPSQFLWSNEAVLRMLDGAAGACATLEVAGEDRGDVPAGWTNNFKLGRLFIGPGAHVQLVDILDNHSPPLSGPEALYVDTLEFADGTGRLHPNGMHMYYHTLIGSPSQIVAGACDSPGDLNCDGLVNNGDIDAFVLALTDASAYAAAYPSCDVFAADVNGDGLVNNGDIDAFVALLTGV